MFRLSRSQICHVMSLELAKYIYVWHMVTWLRLSAGAGNDFNDIASILNYRLFIAIKLVCMCFFFTIHYYRTSFHLIGLSCPENPAHLFLNDFYTHQETGKHVQSEINIVDRRSIIKRLPKSTGSTYACEHKSVLHTETWQMTVKIAYSNEKHQPNKSTNKWLPLCRFCLCICVCLRMFGCMDVSGCGAHRFVSSAVKRKSCSFNIFVEMMFVRFGYFSYGFFLYASDVHFIA